MKDHLSTGQVAALCSVTPDAVLKWVKAGKIPACRTPGGHYRIHRSALPAVLGIGGEDHFACQDRERPFQYCWEYNVKSGEVPDDCQHCLVYRSRAQRCYEISQLPAGSGHAGFFCTESCEDCDYYHLVRQQRPNVLVVTDQSSLQTALESEARNGDYNLCFADCEYQFSMLVEKYRPDYVILDCSMGMERARQFARNISADPRIPFVRIVLVSDRGEFSAECDKEIFATIEKPLSITVLDEFMRWSMVKL